MNGTSTSFADYKIWNEYEVFQAEKVDGIWRQQLKIHYNGIGKADIPQIPNCEVSMQTRKGVTITYSSVENADESMKNSA